MGSVNFPELTRAFRDKHYWHFPSYYKKLRRKVESALSRVSDTRTALDRVQEHCDHPPEHRGYADILLEQCLICGKITSDFQDEDGEE